MIWIVSFSRVLYCHVRIIHFLHIYSLGCSDFDHRVGYFDFDITWQKYLLKYTIGTISPCSNVDLIQSASDDCIRLDDKCKCRLLYSKGRVQPSIRFVDDRGPYIMTCGDHNKGTKKLLIHPCIPPHHILHVSQSDQLCHTVAKSRTLKTLKDFKYSNTFQMYE